MNGEDYERKRKIEKGDIVRQGGEEDAFHYLVAGISHEGKSIL